MRVLLIAAVAAGTVLGAWGAGAENAGTPRWIQPTVGSFADADTGLFRRLVVNRGEVTRAVWTVAALGAFEARVNGGDGLGGYLNGGFTQPEKCRHALTFDVTDRWRRGAGETNRLFATVSASWWRDAIMRRDLVKPRAGYPRNSALWATLRLTYADGSEETVVTDTDWDAVYGGAVVRAGIYEGEVQDLMRVPAVQARDEFASERWEKAAPNHDFAGEVRPMRGPLVRLREDLALKPVGVTLPLRLEPGREYVFDFGQNASAIERMVVEGERQTKVFVRHAEMLNEPGGDPKRGNDGPGGTLYLINLRNIDASTTYTLRDGEQTLTPRFTFFGYRYVGVRVTRPVTVKSLVSVPVTSVARESESASFTCGDADVNRLVSNIRWGFRSNYLSVPTDCPQRNERLGWTADTMVFVRAASYLADVRGFLGKWLADLRDTQSAAGAYEQLAPLVWSASHKRATSGWSDAGVLVPYFLWQHYGDRTLVDENWDSMVRYMDYLSAHGGPDRSCYGDWCTQEMGVQEGNHYVRTQSQEYMDLFSAFYWVWDAQAMRELAAATGRTAEATRFAADERRARAAFAKRYLGSDGRLRPELRCQTSGLYLLKLGLCGGDAAAEEERRELLENFHAKGDRLQTGFMGTAILMDTLTEIGATDLAYTLLLQHENPSWLYSVDQGATTLWERWDSYTKEKGFGNAEMNSFNHYAYGAVFAWMMGTAAGIRPGPDGNGFRKFVLAPHPDRRLGFAKVAYDSPCGRIESHWRYEGDACVWRFRVPDGTTASVRLPGAPAKDYPAGAYELKIEQPKRTVFFGDSITRQAWYVGYFKLGWDRAHPGENLTVVNAGVAGDTAEGALSRFDWDLKPLKPDHVVVMFGMNDVGVLLYATNKPPTSATLAERDERIARYGRNMRSIVRRLKDEGWKVTLMTPTPYDEYSRTNKGRFYRGANDLGLSRCAEEVRRIAAEEKVGLIDLHRPLTEALKRAAEPGPTRDRIHPTEDGARLVAAEMLRQLGVAEPNLAKTGDDYARMRAWVASDSPKRTIPQVRMDVLRRGGDPDDRESFEKVVSAWLKQLEEQKSSYLGYIRGITDYYRKNNRTFRK